MVKPDCECLSEGAKDVTKDSKFSQLPFLGKAVKKTKSLGGVQVLQQVTKLHL